MIEVELKNSLPRLLTALFATKSLLSFTISRKLLYLVGTPAFKLFIIKSRIYPIFSVSRSVVSTIFLWSESTTSFVYRLGSNTFTGKCISLSYCFRSVAHAVEQSLKAIDENNGHALAVVLHCTCVYVCVLGMGDIDILICDNCKTKISWLSWCRNGQLTGYCLVANRDIFFVINRYSAIFTANNNCEKQ